MKQITCAQMGGPATCTVMLAGETPEEMVDNGMEHVNQAHPELAADLSKMSTDDAEKWMSEFRVKFDALPEA